LKFALTLYDKGMDFYSIIKTLHIISSTVLFGTGLGIAFFMFSSGFAHNLHEKYFAARMTVRADFIFTLPAVILQPLTGIYLLHAGGFDPAAPWLAWTFALYLLAGVCWLPVVWIQMRMKSLLAASIKNNTPLPEIYHRLFKIWFLLGWPAFASLVFIFYLMVTKPG
jgi:uncharacterized membrane protein